MKIAIDLQGAQTNSRYRGIGRFSINLARAIAENAGEHDVWLILNSWFTESIIDIRYIFHDLIPQDRICVFDVPFTVNEINPINAWRARAAELLREDFIKTLNPDIIFVSSLFEGYFENAVSSVGKIVDGDKFAITLYDLIPYLEPNDYLPDNRSYEWYQRRIQFLKDSGLHLTISEHSRKEAVEHLGINPERIINISAAAEKLFQPEKYDPDQKNMIKQRYNIDKPYVLYTGGIEKRKNLSSLLIAYSRLTPDIRHKHQLVIIYSGLASDANQVQMFARKTGLGNKDFKLISYVPDKDLVALYNMAEVFVFPSTYEGFGLPPLEAMACGAPVIASNRSSIPEVIGCREALFDPLDPLAIAYLLEKVLTNSGFRFQLKEHGLKQAQQFSWDTSAQKALAAFEDHYKYLSSKYGFTLNAEKGISVRNIPENNDSPITSKRYQSLLDALREIDEEVKPRESDLIETATVIARHHNINNSKACLYVDASELVRHDLHTGVQRVVKKILANLLDHPPDGFNVEPVYEIEGLYYKANRLKLQLKNSNDQPGYELPIIFKPGDIFLGLDLAISRLPPIKAAFHQLRALGVKVHFVVYDLLRVLLPNYFPSEYENKYVSWLETVTNSADGLFCISRSVASELSDWLVANPPTRPEMPVIDYFYLGADFKTDSKSRGLSETDKEFLSRLDNETPTFLMVGTVEPRKGYEQVLSAFENLWQQNITAKLFIAGKQGWMVEDLVNRLRRHSKLGENVFWIEDASDEILLKLYEKATAFIAASEGEGFGLTLIEAAHKNVPIIARDLQVFREIAKENAFYFKGKEPGELTFAIKSWLLHYETGSIPKPDGIKWLTWRESADQLKNLILKHNFKSNSKKNIY